MSIAPLTKQADISNREARPPLTRPSGSFFLALESFLGILGAWVLGCGDSRAEARRPWGQWPNTKRGRQLWGGFAWRLVERKLEQWPSPFSDTIYLLFLKPIFYTLFLKILLSPKDNDIKFVWLVESKGENQ